ncbi:hypothetical protein IGL98_000753 [Enterococcus sp. DIV0840]|uniref:SpaA isopeptide-forming pilin-related protein n=1 Tax=unclassified Enterococcus TaxID=2608891 RepID=UPI001A8E85BD|nr:SpaA isopeptide-forming pilin-related protein [Enterococcus sp. DIV0849a]MBO0435922.1 hypothetical protein [Enterococcus sp. DIV0849a]
MKQKISYLFFSFVLILLAMVSLDGKQAEATQINGSWSTGSTVNSQTVAMFTNDYISNTENSLLGRENATSRFFTPVFCGGVQVLKYDERTNARLSGAQFTIYDSWNRPVQVIETNYKGIAETRSLRLGNYSIRETKAPSGYQIETSEVRFSLLWAGQIVCLTKCNKPLPVQKGSLKVIKTNENKQVLAGAVFDVYNANNQYMGRITTNANGIATLGNLPYGTYKLIEVKAPNGYELDSTPKYVTISATSPSGVGSINIMNKKEIATGELEIIKKDEAGKALAGAEFIVFNSNLAIVGQVQTNANGIAVLKDLPYGNYAVVEMKAPDGYELDSTTKYVTVSKTDPKGKVSITVINKKKITTGALNVIKKDEKGKLLAGAEFEVRDAKNKLVGKITTGTNGIGVLKDLPFGTYKLIETKAPAGYELDGTPKTIKISKDDPNGVISVTVVNKKEKTTGNLEVVKKDEAGAVLAGAEFEVRDANDKVVGKITTDTNGIGVLKDLPFGTYKLIETKAPAGYELDGTPKTIKISKDDPNGVISVTVVNKKGKTTGNLEVVKKDEAGALLAGAEFEVRDAKNKVVGKITTGADGIGVLKDVPFGTYRLVETKAPTGYELDETPKTIKISKDDPNGVISVTVVNKKEKTTGNLEVVKKDEAGAILAGAEFDVYNAADELVGKITTDANGIGQLNDLPYGIYKLIETKAPEGYELDTTPKFVTLSKTDPNGKASIDVVNKKIELPVTGSLKITKYVKDSDPIVYLAGAVFEVYDTNTQLVGTYKTDANGEILLNDLEPGKYYVVEIEAPPGYEQDSTFYEVAVESGKIAEVRHANIKKENLGALKITKFAKDEDGFETDTVLPNAEFEVKDSAGTIHSGVTDTQGELFFPDLPAGEVTITETKAPDGYEIDSMTQTKSIVAGEITEATFYNKPKQEQGRALVYLSSKDAKKELKGLEYSITCTKGAAFETTVVSNTFGQMSIYLPPGEYEIEPVVKGYTNTTKPKSFKIEAKKFTVIRLAI